MPWEDLSVLLAGLQHRSLNRAAEALGVSQSTASRRIARLEERLGARLFDRTPEGLLPTAFALDLAPYAELVAGNMAEIERVAAGQEEDPRGRVRLAVVDGLAPFLVVPGLPRLRARHPAVEIDLLSGQPVLDLVRREADIALRFVYPSTPDLVVRRLLPIEVRPYVHPTLADTPSSRLPWVALLDREGTFPESAWIRKHASSNHVTRVSSWRDLLACVCHGVGAGLLAPWVAEREGLVPWTDADDAPAAEHQLFLVYHRALRDVPRIRAVREWIVDEVERLVPRASTSLP